MHMPGCTVPKFFIPKPTKSGEDKKGEGAWCINIVMALSTLLKKGHLREQPKSQSLWGKTWTYKTNTIHSQLCRNYLVIKETTSDDI
jgi:hypothetical protein